MNGIECDEDGNEDGGRNGDDMIKTKHYLNNIIEMISKLSNVIAITITFIQCRPYCLSIHYKYIYKRLAFISKATSRYVYPQT